MNRRRFLSLQTRNPRSSQTTVNTSALGLEPYSGPWTRKHAAHLVRRVGFGAIKREVDGALNDGSAASAVSRLIQTAMSDPLPEAPSWFQRSGSTGVTEIYEIQRNWLDNMRKKGFVEKMTLFWHNHFSTQYPTNENRANNSIGHIMYDHYVLLRKRAFGNFKSLVRDVSLNPCMLIYLNGFLNRAGHPNEDFGRELLELFTMGQYGPDGSLNYTEPEIKEVARACTGWVVTSDNRAAFDIGRHDRGAKQFFGRTGAYDIEDVINIIFEVRANQIAHFICRKMYVFFVSPRPDEAVVAQMAAEMLASDFEIAPVLEKLLASAHFYQDTFIGSQIKNPLAFFIGFLREAEVVPTLELLEDIREALTPENLGLELLNPPNVAGWPGLNPPDAGDLPGHFSWLTTNTLPERWNILSRLLDGSINYDPFDLVFKISDPSDPFRISRDLAETLVPLDLEVTGIRTVEEDFAGNMSIKPPQDILDGPEYAINLAKILLDGTPHYEWPIITESNVEQADDFRRLISAYLGYLIQLPAYQLT